MGLLLLTAAAPQPPPSAPQPIDPWLLECPPAGGGCTLKYRTLILSLGNSHAKAALEIQRRGSFLVSLRGVSTQMAVGGLPALHPRVVLLFQPSPRADLVSTLDGEAIVCAPQGRAIAATATALPLANSVEARVSLSLAGWPESVPVVQGLNWN